MITCVMKIHKSLFGLFGLFGRTNGRWPKGKAICNSTALSIRIFNPRLAIIALQMLILPAVELQIALPFGQRPLVRLNRIRLNVKKNISLITHRLSLITHKSLIAPSLQGGLGWAFFLLSSFLLAAAPSCPPPTSSRTSCPRYTPTMWG